MKLKKFVCNLTSSVLFIFGVNSIAYASSNIDLTNVRAPLIEITNLLLIIAAGVCIGKCIHIGIKYMMSSAAEKSNAKEAMLPWLIGTFVCFGAAIIGPFIIGLLSDGLPSTVLSY